MNAEYSALKSIFIHILYSALYPLSVAFRVTSIYLRIVATTAPILLSAGIGFMIALHLKSLCLKTTGFS